MPLDFINCALSVILAGLYIYSTFDPLNFAKRQWTHWYPIFLMIAHIYFLIEYLLRLLTAKNVTNYLISMENFFELLTIFPYIIVS